MEPSSNIEQIGELIKSWAENRIEVTKLRFKSINIKVLTTLLKILIPGLCLLLMLIFASAGMVWVLNESLKSTYAGYFIVAVFYLLLAIVIYIFRQEWIVRPLSNVLIKALDHEED